MLSFLSFTTVLHPSIPALPFNLWRNLCYTTFTFSEATQPSFHRLTLSALVDRAMVVDSTESLLANKN